MNDAEPRLLPLHGRVGVRGYALVDQVDYERVARMRWTLHATGYAAHKQSRHNIVVDTFLHRLILGLSPGDGLQVDHINRNRLDCRRANLRVVTQAENCQNVPARRNSSSRHRGVFWHKGRRAWVAAIQVRKVKHHLGVFESEDEAAAVVASFLAQHFPGEIAENDLAATA